jgi:Na+-translocating ferredoxin:NAD+ oxidoreductase subunit C
MIKSSFFGFAKPSLAYPALKLDRPDVVEIPLPAKAQLFLNGSPAVFNGKGLRVGDRVRTGQRIALAGGAHEYMISPVTGSISSISPLTGYLGRTLTAVSFDVESTDTWDEEFGASKEMSLLERVKGSWAPFPVRRIFRRS